MVVVFGCELLTLEFFKANGVARSKEFVGDPRRLRRWLREMETQLQKSPTFSEAVKMKDSALQKLLKEHTVSSFLV